MTNLGAIIAAESKHEQSCLEHSGMCQKIVNVEDKVAVLEHKIDRFFWALLCALAGIVLTLVLLLWNVTLNTKMLAATEAMLKLAK
jgi:hypothetical protein